MTRRPFLLATALLASLVVAPLHAQAGVTIGGRAGTLGIGGELILAPTRTIRLRGGYGVYSISRDQDISGITYTLTPHLEGGQAVVDLHPGGGAFRLSGGFVYNRSRVDGKGVVNGSVTIGNTTYTSSNVGSLTAKVSWPDLRPYAGLGFATGGRVGLSLDLGASFSGYPTFALSGTTNLTGGAATTFQQEILNEAAQANTEIKSHSFLRFYPVVQLGLLIKL